MQKLKDIIAEKHPEYKMTQHRQLDKKDYENNLFYYVDINIFMIY